MLGGVKVLGLCSGENGFFSFRYAHISRAGMQCDKVEKFLKKLCFVKGTDAKSANLPQIFQNLHSHTASVATVTDPYLHNTNFFACNSNPTESTPSEAEPSAECRENTESQVDSESSVGIDSMFDTSDSDSKDSSHPNFYKMDFFTQQLYVIFYETLLPVILRDYDRYSMMNGLEIRMPFMDHRVVEFLFSLPFSYKNGHGYTKRIVRDSMSEIVPKSVIWRKHKIGFNAPMIAWMQRDRAHNGLKEYFLDLAHSQDFLQSPFVKNPQHIQDAIIKICSMEQSSPHLAEEIWCALNPYIWSKSLKYALRF